MSEESKSSVIKDMAEAVATITKEVPIYQDAIQPAAKELGKGFATIAKIINFMLEPFALSVWGYNEIKEYIVDSVSKRLEYVPEENIISPKTNIAGPILEALRFLADEEILREMFSNLLANTMDKKTTNSAHPAFVEILKNMCPDEAKVMRYFYSNNVFRLPIIDIESSTTELIGRQTYIQKFSLIGYSASCEFPESTPNYLDNLGRLGLLMTRSEVHLTQEGIYEPLINYSTTQKYKKRMEEQGRKLEITKGLIELTDFGHQFCKICVLDKNIQV